MRSIARISTKEMWKILELYNALGKFIEKFVDREVIYKKKFVNGLEEALRDIKKERIKQVKSFSDFIS